MGWGPEDPDPDAAAAAAAATAALDALCPKMLDIGSAPEEKQYKA